MRDSDESLLSSFALNRDEAAFRALAERYLGLVFHTALRRTNNRPLAEEVSQNILCALAKKAASLAKTPDLLPAWLHRATLYESSKAMRKESSYQRRKQLQNSDVISESDSPWSNAVTHLDTALNKLPESDRSLLLLHYFENRPFPKIAQSLGKNPAAVQKQSQRALEKLSSILRGRGVTLTATVIATGLTAEFAKAAPATLAQSLSTAVFTGTATYSTTGLTLMTLSKSKALIPLVLLICAVPLAIQQVAIFHARTRIGQLQSGPAPRVATDSRTARVSKRSEPDNLAAWKDLARRFTFDNDKRIELELRDRLAAMSVEQILEKMDQIGTWDLPDGWSLIDKLLKTVVDRDPQKALRHFEGQLADVAGNTQMHLLTAFRKWVSVDSPGAIAWLDALLADGKLESHRTGFRVNESSRNEMVALLTSVAIAKQLETDSGSAIRRYLALESDQKRAVLLPYRLDSLEPVAAAGLVAFMRGTLTEDEYQAYLADRNVYSEMGSKFVQNDDFEGIGRFLDSIDALPAERRAFADGAAASVLYRLKGGEEGTLDRAAVDGLRKWLARVAPKDMDWITGVALTRIHAKFRTTASLVESVHQETGSDEILVAFLGKIDKRKSEKEWEALAAKIKDDAKRHKILSGGKPE